MMNISEILNKRPVETEKVLYPRQEIIKKFVDAINPPRVAAGYRPYSVAFIASKMYNAGIKTDFGFWYFYGYCKEAQNFSATWHWALDPKNAKPNAA